MPSIFPHMFASQQRYFRHKESCAILHFQLFITKMEWLVFVEFVAATNADVLISFVLY